MAANYSCRACMRSLNRHSIYNVSPASGLLRPSAVISRRPSSRCFSTTYRRALATTRDPNPEEEQQNEPPRDSPVVRFAKEVRKRASSQTETYIAYGGTQQLFKDFSKHAAYTIPQAEEKDGIIPKTPEGEDIGVGSGWWHEDVGLPATFSTWAHVSFLYMYLLTTRIRHFPPDIAPVWHQHLTDHFFTHAEDLMTTHHRITSASVRARYLKDLFSLWRGAVLSYDEGMLKGDAVLAAAVWRNVFKSREDVDAKVLAQIVAWMRRELVRLQESDDAHMGSASFEFEAPKDELKAVIVESRLMREGIGNEGP